MYAAEFVIFLTKNETMYVSTNNVFSLPLRDPAADGLQRLIHVDRTNADTHDISAPMDHFARLPGREIDG
jgi:hypothetical protein